MSQMFYSRSGSIIEIIIRDNTGRKIESHTIPTDDKKMYRRIISYIESKYDLKIEIEPSFLNKV
jgi:hypothetical protein